MGMTVVIPSLGLNALLRSCIHALDTALRNAECEARIVVVDNASPDPYRKGEFGEHVDIMRLDEPRSFSIACNRAAFSAPNDIVLFLNNDVLLHPDAITDILETMRETGAAICGARLVYPDDTIQHCGVRIGGPLPAPYHEFNGDPSATVSRAVRDYQVVTGAVLAARFDLFRELDGFDEAFPFAYEDVDFCLRARQKGYRVTCAQRVDSVHFESTTPGRFVRELGGRVIFEKRWIGRCTIDSVRGHYLD